MYQVSHGSLFCLLCSVGGGGGEDVEDTATTAPPLAVALVVMAVEVDLEAEVVFQPDRWTKKTGLRGTMHYVLHVATLTVCQQ